MTSTKKKPSKKNPFTDIKESEWMQPTRDEKGHNSKFIFLGLPWLSKQMNEIVGSKKFPYKSASDFMRHAIFRHCKALLEIEGSLPSVIRQVEIINEILHDEQMNADMELTFNKLTERVSNLISKGDTLHAAQVLNIVKGKIDEMPDGYWKDKYSKDFVSKHGDFLKTISKDKKAKVDFSDMSD